MEEQGYMTKIVAQMLAMVKAVKIEAKKEVFDDLDDTLGYYLGDDKPDKILMKEYNQIKKKHLNFAPNLKRF